MAKKKKKLVPESKVLCEVEDVVGCAIRQGESSVYTANEVVTSYGTGSKLEILAVLNDERYEDLLSELDDAVGDAVKDMHESREAEALSRDGWQFMCRLSPGGTKLFEPDNRRPTAAVPPPGCVFAIADDSGGVPSETDDGILWVDGRRPIRLSTDSEGINVSIPLLCLDGEESMTPSNVKEARKLRHLTGMRVICADPDLKALLK